MKDFTSHSVVVYLYKLLDYLKINEIIKAQIMSLEFFNKQYGLAELYLNKLYSTYRF